MFLGEIFYIRTHALREREIEERKRETEVLNRVSGKEKERRGRERHKYWTVSLGEVFCIRTHLEREKERRWIERQKY